jgi:hypothetical protein
MRIWLAYSLTPREPAAAARWDVTALDSRGNSVASVGQGSLPATGQVAQIDLQLNTRPEGAPGLGISVTASGDIDLRIVAIGLRVGKD